MTKRLNDVNSTGILDELFSSESPEGDDANDGVRVERDFDPRAFVMTYKGVHVTCGRCGIDDEGFQIEVVDDNFSPPKYYSYGDFTYQRTCMAAIDAFAKKISELDGIATGARRSKEGYSAIVDKLAEAMLEDSAPKNDDE